jgi:hypothetical protein
LLLVGAAEFLSQRKRFCETHAPWRGRQSIAGRASAPLYFQASKEMNADDSNGSDENAAFNGAELSESVLARDWNSPEEDIAWSNL